MTDDQIAREFVQKFLIYRNRGVAVSTFVALIAEARREARTEERARCAAIAERYTHTGAGYPVPVERVARDIWYAIRTEGED